MSLEKLNLRDRRERAAKHDFGTPEPGSIHLKIGDSRNLDWIPDESVQLVLTSPPYWNLKKYNDHQSQLGHISDYENFLDELDKVWQHCLRVLIPGGRLVCVVGDVCVSRKQFGRHLVMPLHADIQVRCRKIGFDNLNPIFWYKISNAKCESGGGRFLGKPYEPNAIIKNDMEYILLQRKHGGYRSPTEEQRLKSMISKTDFNKWFQQIWQIPGASTKEHPAPYPLELADRLIRMFSFTGDTVFDPFCGTGTSLIAAKTASRHAIGCEIDPNYAAIAKKRIEQQIDLFSLSSFRFED